MIGFRFARDANYNLPAARLKSIEDYLGRRVSKLLALGVGSSDIKEVEY